VSDEESTLGRLVANKGASADRVVGVTDLIVHWASLGAVIVLALLAIVGLVALVVDLPALLHGPTGSALEGLFSGILLLFILLELYQIGGLYFRRERVVDKVFEVGIVALVRQLIVAEFLHYNVQQLLAIAALVVALGLSWYLTGRVRLPKSAEELRDPAAGT
jgi:uncharacterized membrane protein (DUF373 family)